jgi:hypothetical protein
MGLLIDLSITIAGDASELYIIDNSTGWGEDGTPTKVEIDASEIIIKDADGNALYTTTTSAIDNTLTVTAANLGMTNTVTDAVYQYEYTLQDTTVPWTQTKNGEFSVYRTVQQNIHEDLLTELNLKKAYNVSADYENLTEIRRRSNLLLGVITAEFYAERDNIQNLLTYLETLEE